MSRPHLDLGIEAGRELVRTGRLVDIPRKSPKPKPQEEIQGNATEEEMAFQIRAHGLPKPIRECYFALDSMGREWRADFAWPDEQLVLGGMPIRLMVEVDGRCHLHEDKFKRDMEKSRAAALLGWTPLRFSPKEVTRGTAIALLLEVFAGEWCG